MDTVKVFALGGLDENGKNMYCVEVNDTIFVIEAGIMIPDTTLLGVEFIIPDFTYLIENKDRIGGIFITHAHDDVMRAIPYLLKQIKVPVFTGIFTSMLLEDIFAKEKITDYDLRVIKRTDLFYINGIKIRTFAMTHSVPDSFGIAIHSDQGYIVYSGEYVFDYNLIMREKGDRRGDQITKKELYERYIKDNYNVLCVFDDRQKVVDMWREQGLLCCQVAKGDY